MPSSPLHDQDRRAHLAGDADLLVAGMADYIWEASRGRLTRLARTDVRDRFAAYFAACATRSGMTSCNHMSLFRLMDRLPGWPCISRPR